MDEALKMQLLFQTFGDANRLRIISFVGSGERSVNEIVSATRLSQPLVSHHLRVLRDKQVLETRRKGPFVYLRRKKQASPRCPGDFPGTGPGRRKPEVGEADVLLPALVATVEWSLNRSLRRGRIREKERIKKPLKEGATMSMKEKFMDGMMNGMSSEEKKEMMNGMMEKFFAGMSEDDKREMMKDMMTRMAGGGMDGSAAQSHDAHDGIHDGRKGRQPANSIPWRCARK